MGKKKALDIPVAFGGVSLGDATARLGLSTGICDMFREGGVSTIAGLVELKASIDAAKAVWPKGVGPAKQEDVLKRLEDFRDKHEAAPATS